VPTDGRAGSTDVNIWIYTNKPSPLHEREYITVIEPSTQSLLRSLDNIVVLLTVVAILAIISAIIIAAAVFLSGRRPGVTWQKEE
jgi:subtilase family serine protease